MAYPSARMIARRALHRRNLALATVLAALALPATAQAQCSVDSTGVNVTCSGTSPSYVNTTTTNLNVTVNSGATVAAPLTIGNAGTLTNNGTITGGGAFAVVGYGNSATITNNGTITSTGSTATSAAIAVGDNSTVTNNGLISASTNTPAVKFGVNGTFVNAATNKVAVSGSTTATVIGDIYFGSNSANTYNVGSQHGTFTNNDATYGVVGNVYAYGNAVLTNAGIWSGNLYEFAENSTSASLNASTVSFDNTSAATFAGVVNTAGSTTLTNEGAMTLYAGSTIDSGHYLSINGTASSFQNAGTLTIGTTSQSALISVYGSFTQTSAGTLNFSILPATLATSGPGGTFSQIYATGPQGTASLAGTINLNVAPGFYATGTTYQLVLADQGVTVDPALKLTGNVLPFVTFSSLGVVNCSTGTFACPTTAPNQQAFEVVARHVSDYAAALMASGAAPSLNEAAVARGLNPLLGVISAAPAASPALNEENFLGNVDVLNGPNALIFLDSVSPEGYHAYAEALRDQATSFARTIALRLTDQNSKHDEDGWWLTTDGEYQFASSGRHTRTGMFGITGGYDFSGPHHVYGVAVNISWDTLRYAPATLGGNNRDVALAGYSGWNFGPLHLTGQVGYNFGHLSATKTLVFNTVTSTTTAGKTTSSTSTSTASSTASASEGLLNATATAGVVLKTGMLQVEPFVGVDVMRGQINGFTESNAALPAAQLTVNEINANRTDLIAGVSVTRSRGVLRPYARVAFREREGGDRSTNVTAFFDGQSNSAFTVSALPEGKGELDANAGINWVFDDAGSLFVGYQDTIRAGHHAHGLNLGVRIEF